MKKSSLLIILCFLLICINTSAQKDTKFEFEFELVADDNDDNDDSGNDDNDDDDDDDDGDNDSEDESDDDDGNENNNGNDNSSLLRAEVTLTNVGASLLTEDITFRAHVSTTEPETLPVEYDAESTVTFETPLFTGDTKSFSMLIPTNSLQFGVDNIVTIWPLASSNKNFREESPYVYQLIFIPEITLEHEITAISNITVSKTNIYPNPTNGVLQVETPDNNTFHQITIYNTAGQPIQTFNKPSGLTALNLDLSSGIYFIAIRNERRQIIHYSKLVFHR